MIFCLYFSTSNPTNEPEGANHKATILGMSPEAANIPRKKPKSSGFYQDSQAFYGPTP